MKKLSLTAFVFFSLSTLAIEVTFIPDVHDIKECRDRDKELRDQARDPKGTLYYAMEGISFEAPEVRQHKREVGLETEIPQLFSGYLAYTAFSRQLKLAFKSMTDEEKRFTLSQILVLVTYTGKHKLYDDVMVPTVKMSEKAIPNGKQLLELLKPLAKKSPFEDPKDFDKWIETNQKALEDNAEGLTVMMLLGANYVLRNAIALDKKLEAGINFNKAVQLMNGQLDEKETAQVFAEIDGKMRGPLMSQHLIAAYQEVSAKNMPLTVMAGGKHIKPLIQELRKNTDAKIIIDDAIIKTIDLSKIKKEVADEIREVIAELEALKQ